MRRRLLNPFSFVPLLFYRGEDQKMHLIGEKTKGHTLMLRRLKGAPPKCRVPSLKRQAFLSAESFHLIITDWNNIQAEFRFDWNKLGCDSIEFGMIRIQFDHILLILIVATAWLLTWLCHATLVISTISPNIRSFLTW